MYIVAIYFTRTHQVRTSDGIDSEFSHNEIVQATAKYVVPGDTDFWVETAEHYLTNDHKHDPAFKITSSIFEGAVEAIIPSLTRRI